MNFDPSEVRAPSGSAAGGQWSGGSSAKKPAAKKPAAKAKGSTPAHGLGKARDADAAKAQDAGHQALYDKLMGLSAAKRGAYAKGLSDDDLSKATEAAYSFKSADPDVVRARVALANEMAKRGIDIKKHGALGGGGGAPRRPAPAPARRASPAQAHAVAHVQARKAAAAPAAKAAAGRPVALSRENRPGTTPKGGPGRRAV